jgi:DNA polymerase
LRPTDGEFDALAAAAQACRRCPSMEGRRRVLSHANGSPASHVLLVGEAPGRLGAERTGVPFSGDEAGRRLERLLAAAGWSRGDVFITNAVLCNPRDAAGLNRRPSRRELGCCQPWLARQLDLIQPILVVALGATALATLRHIAPHPLRVADAGRLPIPWTGRWLAAVYHPGARSAVHRSFERQCDDFRRLGDWLRVNGGSDACP